MERIDTYLIGFFLFAMACSIGYVVFYVISEVAGNLAVISNLA